MAVVTSEMILEGGGDLVPGSIVQYRQKFGMQAWLAAVVTVTEESWIPGRWEEGKGLLSRSRRWLPAAITSPKESTAHLLVLSPTGENYVEFSVPCGAEPGCWRWPTNVGLRDA